MICLYIIWTNLSYYSEFIMDKVSSIFCIPGSKTSKNTDINCDINCDSPHLEEVSEDSSSDISYDSFELITNETI